MTSAFDDRLLQVEIGVGNDIKIFEDLFITAQGIRYGSATVNECQIRIENLTREHRNTILSESSPFLDVRSRLAKTITVRAGRKSNGASLLFTGTVSTLGITQPPDIGLVINAITSLAVNLETVAISMPERTSLSNIAQAAANQFGAALEFTADDKSIANYAFTGSPQSFIEDIGNAGQVDAFIDNTTLVVKNKNAPRVGKVKKLDLKSGMIGIPEYIELGVRVKMMFDPNVTLGGQIDLTSELNPSLNGSYCVVKLSFDLASRDTPFYYIAECRRIVQ